MILDSKSGLRGKFYRVDSGERVRWVRWYDTDTHKFSAFRIDPDAAKKAGVP